VTGTSTTTKECRRRLAVTHRAGGVAWSGVVWKGAIPKPTAARRPLRAGVVHGAARRRQRRAVVRVAVASFPTLFPPQCRQRLLHVAVGRRVRRRSTSSLWRWRLGLYQVPP